MYVPDALKYPSHEGESQHLDSPADVDGRQWLERLYARGSREATHISLSHDYVHSLHQALQGSVDACYRGVTLHQNAYSQSHPEHGLPPAKYPILLFSSSSLLHCSAGRSKG